MYFFPSLSSSSSSAYLPLICFLTATSKFAVRIIFFFSFLSVYTCNNKDRWAWVSAAMGFQWWFQSWVLVGFGFRVAVDLEFRCANLDFLLVLGVSLSLSLVSGSGFLVVVFGFEFGRNGWEESLGRLWDGGLGLLSSAKAGRQRGFSEKRRNGKIMKKKKKKKNRFFLIMAGWKGD